MHSALRWLTVNHGVSFGERTLKRTFLCWNPEGDKVLSFPLFELPDEEKQKDFVSYRKALAETIGG